MLYNRSDSNKLSSMHRVRLQRDRIRGRSGERGLERVKSILRQLGGIELGGNCWELGWAALGELDPDEYDKLSKELIDSARH
jgi:hypothetical protein